MVNTQLYDYIKQQLAQGVSKENIQSSLASTGGWALADINEAFSLLEGTQVNSAPAVPINNNISPQTDVKYAGFWIRFVAIMVDSIILIIPAGVLQLTIGFTLVSSLSSNYLPIVSSLISTLVTWTYFSLMTYYLGATLGKMLVGITVKSDNFERLSFGRVLLRETIGKFVSGIILCIGYIIAGVTQRKQALHDKFAHSVVVYKDPSKPHTAGLIVGVIIAAVLPAIAIVGILSSVVLVSLNTARQAGKDAQVRSALTQMRTVAEVYYGQNNSYSTANNCQSGMFASDSSFDSIMSKLTVTDKNKLMCSANGTSYAISAPLSTVGESYCVDSSGFSGNGTLVNDGSKISCAPAPASSVNNVMGNAVGTSPTLAEGQGYSYTLPAGWKIAQNGSQGMQALNQSSGYLLSITATAIPSLYGSVTSVSQVVSLDQLKSSLIKKYPNAVIGSANTGTIGAKKAYIMNYNMSASDLTNTQNNGQSKQVSVTEYSTVYNGNFYTIAFVSALSDETNAQNDLQSIISSFKFK